MKKPIIIIVILFVAVGVYFLAKGPSNVVVAPVTTDTVNTTQTLPTQNNTVVNNGALKDSTQTVLGKSVEGRDITAYHYGTGAGEIIFTFGIHGGYAWNTVLLGYQVMDYLKKNPNVIPANVKVTVIPVLNPDGLNKTIGKTGVFTSADVPTSQEALVAGRFNGHNVDLNRNFDCDWQSTGTWQNKAVSGGTSAFSEPESQAVKNYVQLNSPVAVIAWYSAAGGVYASSCHNGVSIPTNTIMKAFADASKYSANADFDFYEITGDMVNWLAKNNIPAISVILTNHTDIEWTKNLAGITAVLNYFGTGKVSQ